MVGLIVFGVLTVVIVGPKAFGNMLGGTHDFSDGYSVKYREEGRKYKAEQYNRYK